MDDVKMDALLSMMQIEELEEALDLIREWGGDGNLTEAEAKMWRQRIDEQNRCMCPRSCI